MAEEMTFLPRAEVLTIEEFIQLGKTFCELGVDKIRITGGEPLIRKGVVTLIEALSNLPQAPEICLTTNGTHLATLAPDLKAAGLSRINISLDSLSEEKFTRLTRVGKLADVLTGIDAAKSAGFTNIKLNTVVLKNYNADDVNDLVQFALHEGLDISFIEEMPLGEISEHGRAAEFMSSADIREQLLTNYALIPIDTRTAGPSRYWKAKGHNSKIGFISPHSENFCGSCNRVRITAVGKLILCLGQENALDLRNILREASTSDKEMQALLTQAIQHAITHKPEKHDFNLNDQPQILRFMNMTGG